jgi:hypothetical protein
MTAETGIAMQRRAVERALRLGRRGNGLVAEGRIQPLEAAIVEAVHGDIDAVAFLDAVGKLLAEIDPKR